MGERELYWDATYEIVLALMEIHGDVDPEQVGVEQLRKMIVALPGFADDPLMVTESILHEILREWYEEITN
jgi:FeS assembly protein IscX